MWGLDFGNLGLRCASEIYAAESSAEDSGRSYKRFFCGCTYLQFLPMLQCPRMNCLQTPVLPLPPPPPRLGPDPAERQLPPEFSWKLLPPLRQMPPPLFLFLLLLLLLFLGPPIISPGPIPLGGPFIMGPLGGPFIMGPLGPITGPLGPITGPGPGPFIIMGGY